MEIQVAKKNQRKYEKLILVTRNFAKLLTRSFIIDTVNKMVLRMFFSSFKLTTLFSVKYPN